MVSNNVRKKFYKEVKSVTFHKIISVVGNKDKNGTCNIVKNRPGKRKKIISMYDHLLQSLISIYTVYMI